MTREDIVEKVNALLAEEFEVDAEEFVPDANVPMCDKPVAAWY